MSLYPIISQVGYPGAGDVDECAIISLYRAIRQAGYRGPLPTIATFRAAAGVPDRPGKPDGLVPPQVMAALRKLLPDVKAELFSGTFEAFVARLADGTSASVAVWSAYLPSSVRYGFAEGHSIGIDARGAVFTIANPLGPDGSAPVAINARALRAAAGGYAGSGRAVAILIPPVEDTMSVATVTILVKPAAPRRFAVAAGVTLRGYDPARPGV
ncbi:MAG: hypothetical protein KJ888_20530, partial [Gammaproteobacteria bacterium]|nr:hypothetical protein [Gammaproteobacteria bacterium]